MFSQWFWFVPRGGTEIRIEYDSGRAQGPALTYKWGLFSFSSVGATPRGCPVIEFDNAIIPWM
jgi:hypothetical protein